MNRADEVWKDRYELLLDVGYRASIIKREHGFYL